MCQKSRNVALFLLEIYLIRLFNDLQFLMWMRFLLCFIQRWNKIILLTMLFSSSSFFIALFFIHISLEAARFISWICLYFRVFSPRIGTNVLLHFLKKEKTAHYNNNNNKNNSWMFQKLQGIFFRNVKKVLIIKKCLFKYFVLEM